MQRGDISSHEGQVVGRELREDLAGDLALRQDAGPDDPGQRQAAAAARWARIVAWMWKNCFK